MYLKTVDYNAVDFLQRIESDKPVLKNTALRGWIFFKGKNMSTYIFTEGRMQSEYIIQWAL